MLKKTPFFIALLAIIAALVLSYVSWLEICTDMCVGTKDYRLFGMKFQHIGLIFFPLLLISHILSWKSRTFAMITGLTIAGALGSEVIFIWIQKFEIKAWCPVCLAIAGSLLVAGFAYIVRYLIHLNQSIESQNKEEMMKNVRKGISSLAVFAIGVFAGIVGVTKVNPLEAMQNSVKESIIFGNQSSPIEIYIFTDWQCPACRKLEPNLPSILSAAEKKAKIVFIDVDIHPETLNFIPYNLSFMIHNKDKYLKLRDILTEISEETGAPTEEEVEEEVSRIGVTYEQLNFADVAVGNKYFKHMASEFDINSTPTIVIVNRDTKKGKKLRGWREATSDNVLKAINSVR